MKTAISIFIRCCEATFQTALRNSRSSIVRVALFVLCIGGSISLLSEESQTSTQTLSKLSHVVHRAQKTFKEGAEHESVSSINASVDALFTRLSLANVPLSVGFVRTLSYDAVILSKAIDEHDLDLRLRELKAAEQDLGVKAAFVTNGLGATDQFPSVVQVTVRTVEHGQDASNYFVRCSPLLFPGLDCPEFNFNNPSNPTTTALLPPGYFVMWGVKGSFKSAASEETVRGTNTAEPPILLEVAPN